MRVAGRELTVHALHAGGRARQAGPVGILPDRLEDGAHGAFDRFIARPRATGQWSLRATSGVGPRSRVIGAAWLGIVTSLDRRPWRTLVTALPAASPRRGQRRRPTPDQHDDEREDEEQKLRSHDGAMVRQR